MFGGDIVEEGSIDVVQVSENGLRQLNDLLVPVRSGHLKQSWIEDRQNDGDVVTDQCRDVLVAPERQHSLRYLATNTANI